MKRPNFPSSDVEHSAFVTYRKQKRAIFCYIQGMESGNCLMQNRGGEIVELGVQSFPG
jgi:hypothetical protein